jgi:serine/threonine protein kinase
MAIRLEDDKTPKLIRTKLAQFAELERSVSGRGLQDQCLSALTFFHTFDATPPCFALAAMGAYFLTTGCLWRCPCLDDKPEALEIPPDLPYPDLTTLFALLFSQDDCERDHEILGEGTYGVVYHGWNKVGHELAIKIAHPRSLDDGLGNRFESPDYIMQVLVVAFIRELLCTLHCRHPAVLPIVGWNIYPRNPDHEFVVATPFQRHRNVSANLEEMTDIQRLIVAYGVARGMAHLHALRIIHRDLKPANILLDANFHPVIGDLGWAKVAIDGKQWGRRGTAGHIAPEARNKKIAFPAKLDVYSYGIFLWELIAQQEYQPRGGPAARPDVDSKKEPIERMHLPKGYLERCWNVNPEKRPTFDEIVKTIEDSAISFPDRDKRKFNEYKAELDKEANSHACDPNFFYLLLRIRALDDLPPPTGPACTPLTETFIEIFSKLLDPQIVPQFATVLRYLFVTKGCLDAGLYHHHMSLLEQWGMGRRRFGLGAFLVDPADDFGPEWQIDRIDITGNVVNFLRALRTVFVLECGKHPSIVGFRGWNITRDSASGCLSFILVTGKRTRFELSEGNEKDFVNRLFSGMSHLHSLGIAHGPFSVDSICLDHESNARICEFGLIESDDDGLAQDVAGCQYLLCRVLKGTPNFLVNWIESPYAFDRAVTNLFPEPIEPVGAPPLLDLDLLATLSGDVDMWKIPSGSQALDVGNLLSRTTHGLDSDGREEFSKLIVGLLDTVGCLRRDDLDAFERTRT